MKKSNIENSRLFSKFSLLTLIAVYLLILVGGVVRSTGSGMGCPDWPKCFGNWVPPTDVSQLPENYKEIYSQKREKKNERFAKYLSGLGFKDTADKILNDESILHEADFNKQKTWIEYINRLLGVLIGLLIIGTFVLSIRFLKTDRSVFFVALTTLLLVIFQGWIGSIVVSTNLVPWTITLHMFLALLIVALLVYLVHRTNYDGVVLMCFRDKTLFLVVLAACMITSLIQVALGTQVREMVDVIAAQYNYADRNLWIDSIGMPFLIHRSFSWVILLLHMALVYLLFKTRSRSGLTVWLVATVVITIVTGVIMGYFGIPAFIQPVHLLLGTLVFGLQFSLFLRMSGVKGKLA
ncbi:COX15/CtaA family protein [Fulvivirga sp. 29W222]|uniref:COX15/CtaA family protein n=1 Tax=Fulvivirga marina TaxID=2494733 RepID=A0A937KCC4_9BACT|nr:COX15/CtaA family protein [Fulvivirga marina]MBL6445098.1 COX15/CtaA family protein [Fulvivirga marina]